MLRAILLGLCVSTFLSPLAEARRTPTFADVINPQFYIKRKEPILNVGILYYGNEKSEADVTRIQALLEKRFFEATDSMIRLNTVFTAKVPYLHQIQNYPDYTQPGITDPVRLQRLWYYDNVNAGIIEEIYQEAKKSEQLKPQLKALDAIAAMTGAQFDGMGFAYGRMAVTESPREVAWGLPGGGRVEDPSDGQVVDELIHEIGHTLFLDHASAQCYADGMTMAQSKACCEASPGRNDVMSYCRQRNKVDNDTFFHGFEACNRRIMKNQIVPAMLSGGAWNIKNREKCL